MREPTEHVSPGPGRRSAEQRALLPSRGETQSCRRSPGRVLCVDIRARGNVHEDAGDGSVSIQTQYTRRVGRHTHRHARPERGAHAHSPCSPVPPQKPLSRLLSAVSPLALPPNQPRVTLLAEHVPFSLDLCGTDSSGHQSPIFWPHCSQGIIKATHQAQPSPDWGRAGLKVAGQEIPRASRLSPRSMLPTTRRELHVGPRPLPRGESDR